MVFGRYVVGSLTRSDLTDLTKILSTSLHFASGVSLKDFTRLWCLLVFIEQLFFKFRNLPRADEIRALQLSPPFLNLAIP